MTEKQKVIFEIQDYLRNISGSVNRIPTVVSDGIFGDETTEAVRIFQQIYEIEADGKVNLETWNKLIEVNRLTTEKLAQPFRIAPIEENDLPLKKGDSGVFVTHLKLMLSFLGENFSNFTKENDSDIFDELTENQVKKWQRVISHPQSGQADKTTWNTLAALYTT